jgi:hypothetical protein
MDVKAHHLAPTPVGRAVRATSRIIQIDSKRDVRGQGLGRRPKNRHPRRGIVNAVASALVQNGGEDEASPLISTA